MFVAVANTPFRFMVGIANTSLRCIVARASFIVLFRLSYCCDSDTCDVNRRHCEWYKWCCTQSSTTIRLLTTLLQGIRSGCSYSPSVNGFVPTEKIKAMLVLPYSSFILGWLAGRRYARKHEEGKIVGGGSCITTRCNTHVDRVQIVLAHYRGRGGHQW